MKDEEILHRVKEKRNILHTTAIKRRKANWICHMLQRKYFRKQVTEGRIEGMGSCGRRSE
jgi:hypothetical protein